MLKAKIHRCKVTQAELDYFGSITVDEVLLKAVNIYEYEKVLVTNMKNGSRLETPAVNLLRSPGWTWKKQNSLFMIN